MAELANGAGKWRWQMAELTNGGAAHCGLVCVTKCWWMIIGSSLDPSLHGILPIRNSHSPPLPQSIFVTLSSHFTFAVRTVL
jgi:hypothetical protein